MKTNLFILSVIFAAVPEVAAADTTNEAATNEAAQLYTFNPANDLTALSLAGYKIEKFTISKA